MYTYIPNKPGLSIYTYSLYKRICKCKIFCLFALMTSLLVSALSIRGSTGHTHIFVWISPFGGLSINEERTWVWLRMYINTILLHVYIFIYVCIYKHIHYSLNSISVFYKSNKGASYAGRNFYGIVIKVYDFTVNIWRK